MPLLTLQEAYKAWGDTLNHYLREPTDDELAALMPADHPIDVEKMTVGEVQDLQANLWKASQIRHIIGLLRKEVAYARRNEQHVISRLFTKAELDALSPQTISRLKERFDELNEVVKGSF